MSNARLYEILRNESFKKVSLEFFDYCHIEFNNGHSDSKSK